MFPRRQHRRGPGLGMLMLGAQMAQVGFNNIPPVTLVAIIGQVVAYLRLLNIHWPSTSQVCVSVVNVWYRKEYDRILLAALFHADEWHLYFNMVSLLWKGLKLEPRVGSGYFLYMLLVFAALSNALYIALGVGAEMWFHDPSYLSSCAVGFSGVLFALKVVATHMSPPGMQSIMGIIPVPSRYACWAELFLIHLLVPRASFIGHLSGIIVGLLYVKGPIKPLMDSIISPSPTVRLYARDGFSLFGSFGGQPQTRRNAPSRYRDWASSEQTPPPPTEEYTGGMSEEEQMQHAMQQSLRENRRANVQRPEPSAPPAHTSTRHNDTHGPPYPSVGGEYDTNGPPYPGSSRGEYDTSAPPYPSVGGEYDNSGPPYPAGAPGGPPNRQPPAYSGLYPDLSTMHDSNTHTGARTDDMSQQEEIRRRRLQRFNKK